MQVNLHLSEGKVGKDVLRCSGTAHLCGLRSRLAPCGVSIKLTLKSVLLSDTSGSLSGQILTLFVSLFDDGYNNINLLT